MKQILLLFLSILTFTGCSQKVNLKDIYTYEYDNLMTAVNDLSLYKNIKEVTKESPGILSDSYYKKYNNMYYIFETKPTDKNSNINAESIDNINNLVDNHFERIIIDRDEDIYIFQIVSELGHGEYLIYSKNKTQQSDDTLILSNWLDANWYIATSNG